MKIQTHQAIDPEWVGQPITVEAGMAVVELVTLERMAADASGLVHGGFVFGLADYAAMLAVNEPTVVLANSSMKFLRPTRAGATLRARAEVVSVDGRKHRVDVRVEQQDTLVARAEFGCFVPEQHVLDTTS